MTISQKDAVYNCVVGFLSEKGIQHEDGNKVELAKDERKTVIGMLIAATNEGVCEVKSATARADLSNYWNGTLSNWLRKDTRLNGGDKYVTKNPGSRAGAGDEKLREMKKLLAKVTLSGNEQHITAVTEAIELRKAEIAEEQAAKLEIDTDILPDALKHLV